MKKLLIVIFVLFFTFNAFADTIVLNNGKKIEGKVISKTDEGYLFKKKSDNKMIVIQISDVSKIIKSKKKKPKLKLKPESKTTLPKKTKPKKYKGKSLREWISQLKKKGSVYVRIKGKRVVFVGERTRRYEEAVKALTEIAHEQAIPSLIEVLRNNNGGGTTSRLFYYGVNKAFVKIGKPAVPALIKLLQRDKNERVRNRAANLLGAIGDKSAIPALIKALWDKGEYVSQNAALALVKIKDKSAIPELLKALENENINVNKWAKKALKGITDQDFDQDTAKWQKWWDENKDKTLKEEAEKNKQAK